MRIRTLLAMAFGAAVGAGTIYLFDPDQGRTRRRAAAGRARREAAERARGAAAGAARQARSLVVEARRGFVDERAVG